MTDSQRRSARPVILLTGASSGIGEATARELAQRNYALVLAARRADRLHALARQLDPTGSRVLAVPTDLTVDEERRNLLARAHEHFGAVDVLINNAGVTVEKGWWWDDWNRVGKAVERDLREEVRQCLANQVFIVPIKACDGAEDLAKKREGDCEDIKTRLDELEQKLNENGEKKI